MSEVALTLSRDEAQSARIAIDLRIRELRELPNVSLGGKTCCAEEQRNLMCVLHTLDQVLAQEPARVQS